MQFFGKDVPCGCEQREEIMGAGEWQHDAMIIGGGIFALLLLFLVYKK